MSDVSSLIIDIAIRTLELPITNTHFLITLPPTTSSQQQTNRGGTTWSTKGFSFDKMSNLLSIAFRSYE